MRFCYLCGLPPTDKHHIFNGAERNNSEKYGAVIQVCRKCHNEIHRNAKLRLELKAEFQHKIMCEYNLTLDQFREIFKKSYL